MVEVHRANEGATLLGKYANIARPKDVVVDVKPAEPARSKSYKVDQVLTQALRLHAEVAEKISGEPTPKGEAEAWRRNMESMSTTL